MHMVYICGCVHPYLPVCFLDVCQCKLYILVCGVTGVVCLFPAGLVVGASGIR